MSIERRLPYPFEAPFDGAPPGGSGIEGQAEQIERQIALLEQEPEYWVRLDYNLLHLQRRALDYRAHWQSQMIPADEMVGLLARTRYDIRAYDRDSSHAEDISRVQALTYAYTAFAFPTFSRYQQLVSIELYNQMQQAVIAEGDEPQKGVELSAPLVTTLTWMLDQSAIPHTLTNADMCIPFASLEAQMRDVAQEEGVSLFTTPTHDHETTANVYGLMNQWQNSQGETG